MKISTQRICTVLAMLVVIVSCSDRIGSGNCAYSFSDLPNAAELYQKSEFSELREYVEPDAIDGNPGAQLAMGEFLYESNPEEAFEWLLLAAGQRCTIAHMMLATMYDEGHGVTQSAELAFQWFLSAAELGNPGAAQMVSQLYLMGEGVEQDDDLHYYWLEKAFELSPDRQ